MKKRGEEEKNEGQRRRRGNSRKEIDKSPVLLWRGPIAKPHWASASLTGSRLFLRRSHIQIEPDYPALGTTWSYTGGLLFYMYPRFCHSQARRSLAPDYSSDALLLTWYLHKHTSAASPCKLQLLPTCGSTASPVTRHRIAVLLRYPRDHPQPLTSRQIVRIVALESVDQGRRCPPWLLLLRAPRPLLCQQSHVSPKSRR